MKSLLRYLNPIARLGKRKYSIILPLFITTGSALVLETIAYLTQMSEGTVGIYAIVAFIALIIYCSFRDGIRGGFIASTITLVYYGYIIYTRHHTGQQLITSIETTIFLGAIYFLLAGIIGWLKQSIDRLIEQEADEKRRLQAIVQQLPVGVIITDHRGRVVLANTQVDSMLGTKIPVGFMAGKETLVESMHKGKQMTPSQSLLAQALASGKAIVGREYIVNRHDRKQVHIQASVSPVHNKEGKIIAAACIISDVTQQKEMEQRKDDFVNMASHELKTPITSMKLYIDSLLYRLQSHPDERAVRIVSHIKNQTERLQKLVNDLLDISRLQTGKLSFTKEEFRLDTVIEETIDVLQGATKKQEIVFMEKFPLTISGDRFRMYQVLTNLIMNAVKYSPEGKKIIIRMRQDGKKVVVSIQDFGIGIAKEQHKKIFERLYQVTDDTEKTFPGFGMGLYIAKEIIQRHRGAIWVESVKGKGSTFYISLPIYDKKSTGR